MNRSPNNIAMSSDNRVMFISGTHRNEMNPASDYYTDFRLALGQLPTTARFRQAEQMLHLYNPEVLVGHSLGSSIAKELHNRYAYKPGYNLRRSRYYNPPFTPFTRLGRGEISMAHRLDPVGVLDTVSQRSFHLGSPHSYRGHTIRR